MPGIWEVFHAHISFSPEKTLLHFLDEEADTERKSNLARITLLGGGQMEPPLCLPDGKDHRLTTHKQAVLCYAAYTGTRVFASRK